MSSTVTAGRQIVQAALDAANAGQIARLYIVGFTTPLDITSGSVNNEVAELKNRGNFTYHVALSAIYALTIADVPPRPSTRRLDTPGSENVFV